MGSSSPHRPDESELQRRRSAWQLDPRRRRWRLCFAVRGEATSLHPPALGARLAQALSAAGLPVALGLEKRPRPMVHLGHPLPPGLEGLQEWADVDLHSPSPFPPGLLPERVRPHLAPGLEVLEAEEIPLVASPVLDLCRTSIWGWPCPEGLAPAVRSSLEGFLEADHFQIEKTGKVNGQKVLKQIEVRAMVETITWTGDHLHLRTRIEAGEALNPQKLLGGILGMEPSIFEHLYREAVLLGPDPRLEDPQRFETKLHNIFEDAVLLQGGEGPTFHEDDDEILSL